MSEISSVPSLENQKLPITPYDLFKKVKTYKVIEISFRPLSKTDIPLWAKFIQKCSKDSLYSRFMATISDLADQGEVFCNTNFDTTITIAAEVTTKDGNEIVGITWLIRDKNTDEVEVAFLVNDIWQHQGIGSSMAEFCHEILIKWKIRAVSGTTSIYNQDVIRMLANRNIEYYNSVEENTLNFKLTL